jgi:hypothetical protein
LSKSNSFSLTRLLPNFKRVLSKAFINHTHHSAGDNLFWGKSEIDGLWSRFSACLKIFVLFQPALAVFNSRSIEYCYVFKLDFFMKLCGFLVYVFKVISAGKRFTFPGVLKSFPRYISLDLVSSNPVLPWSIGWLYLGPF